MSGSFGEELKKRRLDLECQLLENYESLEQQQAVRATENEAKQENQLIIAGIMRADARETALHLGPTGEAEDCRVISETKYTGRLKPRIQPVYETVPLWMVDRQPTGEHSSVSNFGDTLSYRNYRVVVLDGYGELWQFITQIGGDHYIDLTRRSLMGRKSANGSRLSQVSDDILAPLDKVPVGFDHDAPAQHIQDWRRRLLEIFDMFHREN